MLKIAILDDYANVALQSADWSVLQGKAEITVFDRHLSEDEAVSSLPRRKGSRREAPVRGNRKGSGITECARK